MMGGRMAKKKFRTIVTDDSGKQIEYIRHAANEGQFFHLVRSVHNKARGKVPEAYVKMSEITEVK